MGFEGTEVTPQIRKLISEHHIGSILLKASNLKCKSRMFSDVSRVWFCLWCDHSMIAIPLPSGIDVESDIYHGDTA